MTDTSSDIERLDPNFAKADPEKGLRWYDIRPMGVEGRGFEDTESFYDRLPARAEGLVPEAVWELSRHSSGMSVRFMTDSKSIAVRWTLRNENLAMAHMPATGVSGLDLYARHADCWRFLGTARPTVFPHNEYSLATSLQPSMRQYRLYLPLYNGVTEVQIGIPEATSMAKAPPAPADRSQPIVFYGTSVVQGGCASRPGMTHSAILGRRLDRPIVNLGFSGNGRAETEVARLLAEIEAAVFVIDTVPNMTEAQVQERIVPFVTAVREGQPRSPIVVVEHFAYPAEELVVWMPGLAGELNLALERCMKELHARGIDGLHVFKPGHWTGDDGEGTVDGTHSTDLGFIRMADALQPLLESLL